MLAALPALALLAAGVIEIPIELRSDAIILRARVNGRGPYEFVWDTGSAGVVLDSGLAGELGLATEKPEVVRGVGSDPVTISDVPDAVVTIGGVKAHARPARATNLDEILRPYAGQQVLGLIGNDLAERYVVELDYDAGRLRLHDPAGYEYSGSGEIIPVRRRGWTFAEATVVFPGGRVIRGEFVVDTAAAATAAVFLNRPVVVRERILGLDQPMIDVMSAGISGPARFRLTRIEKLRLGGLEIERPTTALSLDETGVLTSSEFTGILGAEILSRFKVIFDYARDRVILEKGRRFDEPFEADMSGLFFVAEGQGFDSLRVIEVVEDSPAAHAGLLVDDRIIAIDDKPVAGIPSYTLRQRLQVPDEVVRLRVRRDERVFDVRLVTRRLVRGPDAGNGPALGDARPACKAGPVRPAGGGTLRIARRSSERYTRAPRSATSSGVMYFQSFPRLMVFFQ